jgi:uncharacterized protein YjiK
MRLVKYLPLLLMPLLAGCGGSSDSTDSPAPGQGLELQAVYSVAVSDPSGLALDLDGVHLWTVSDDPGRGMYQLTRQGVVVRHVPFASDDLEGITINTRTGEFFIVNEKNPRLLLRLGPDLQVRETVALNFTGPFFMGDLSGISYDAVEDTLWIISDESRKIVVIDMQYNPLRAYPTGIRKGEGIAVDPDNRRVYAVCDEESRLYVYSY